MVSGNTLLLWQRICSHCSLPVYSQTGSHREVQLFFISYHLKIEKQRQGIHVHTQTHRYTHTQAPCKSCLLCIIPDTWFYWTWKVLLAAAEDILPQTPWSVYLETLRAPRVLSLQEPPKQEAVMGPRAAFTSNVALASFQPHNTEHMLGLKFHQLSKQTTRSSCGPGGVTRWEVSPSCNVRDQYAQVPGARPSVSRVRKLNERITGILNHPSGGHQS